MPSSFYVLLVFTLNRSLYIIERGLVITGIVGRTCDLLMSFWWVRGVFW